MLFIRLPGRHAPSVLGANYEYHRKRTDIAHIRLFRFHPRKADEGRALRATRREISTRVNGQFKEQFTEATISVQRGARLGTHLVLSLCPAPCTLVGVKNLLQCMPWGTERFRGLQIDRDIGPERPTDRHDRAARSHRPIQNQNQGLRRQKAPHTTRCCGCVCRLKE